MPWLVWNPQSKHRWAILLRLVLWHSQDPHLPALHNCQVCLNLHKYKKSRECSGSVVECLTQDRRAAGSSLTGITALCPWARHINPSLVLVPPRKTHPFITERLLMGHIEPNQTNKQSSTSGHKYKNQSRPLTLYSIIGFFRSWHFLILNNIEKIQEKI